MVGIGFGSGWMRERQVWGGGGWPAIGAKSVTACDGHFAPLRPYAVQISYRGDPVASYGCIATTGGSKSTLFPILQCQLNFAPSVWKYQMF
jgi:hypothetical protein